MAGALFPFTYSGFDAVGRSVKGTRTAESAVVLGRTLVGEGILVSTIKPVTGAASRFEWPRYRKIRPFDCAFLMRQLATLQASGLPLDESLGLMALQADKPVLKDLISRWQQQLVEGLSLTQAMRESALRMPDSVIAAIAVAEETGHLPQVLDRLADELEEGATARQDLRKGLVYPLVMATVGLAVSIAMMIWVVPQVTKVFIAQRVELPLLTRFMIAGSELLVNYGWLMLLMLGVAAAWAKIWFSTPLHRLALHRRLLRLPLLGNWMLTADVADWSRHIGTLLASGVPVVAALRIAGESVRNLALRQVFERISEDVRTGQGVHASMRKHGQLPAFLLHMVGSGEASSQLDTMLLRVASYYSRLLKSSTETALKLIEPALILLMAGFVMMIVGAVLVPIVRMNHMI